MAVVAQQSNGAEAGILKERTGAVPARRVTKEQLLKTHKTHLKKQDLSPNAPRPVKQPILSEAYPASTKSIRDVEIIPLSDLRVETHHRGQGIIVRVASPPFFGAGAVSIVEDEHGNADKLAIYNQGDTSILSGVPEGCVVAVKEPYYQYNGSDNDYMICVDHPSDVILLRFTDPIIPGPLRLGTVLQTAEDWKKAGDTAFLEKDFPTAVFCYTESLESDPTPGVFGKRSSTNLLLGRYDAALSDALASRTDAPSDWKAYFNAGRAAYGLCNYKTALPHLERALALSPANANVRKEHTRCLARLAEEQTGALDFSAMHALLSPSTVHLDRASFLSRTAIRPSPHHGRGLFAACAIPAGGLVLAEKAAFMPNQYDPARSSAALYAMTVRQLTDNPSIAASVLALHAGPAIPYAPALRGGTLVDGVPVIDVFLVEGVRQKNCFTAPLSTLADTKTATPSGPATKGLWLHAAAMNHACVPNTARAFVGDFLISRATRDIAAGEELFHAYVPVKPDAGERARAFEAGWGFACRCALCDAERDSTEAAQARRRDLAGQVERACAKRMPGAGVVVPDSAIRAVEKLHKQLEEAHEKEVYDGAGRCLPRLMLVYPCNWLLRAYLGRRNWRKVAAYAKRVVRNFGFHGVPLEEDGEAGWDPRGMFTAGGSQGALMPIHVVAALRRLAEAYEALGEKELARRCTEASELGYTMVTGFEGNSLAGID